MFVCMNRSMLHAVHVCRVIQTFSEVARSFLPAIVGSAVACVQLHAFPVIQTFSEVARSFLPAVVGSAEEKNKKYIYIYIYT